MPLAIPKFRTGAHRAEGKAVRVAFRRRQHDEKEDAARPTRIDAIRSGVKAGMPRFGENPFVGAWISGPDPTLDGEILGFESRSIRNAHPSSGTGLKRVTG